MQKEPKQCWPPESSNTTGFFPPGRGPVTAAQPWQWYLMGPSCPQQQGLRSVCGRWREHMLLWQQLNKPGPKAGCSGTELINQILICAEMNGKKEKNVELFTSPEGRKELIYISDSSALQKCEENCYFAGLHPYLKLRSDAKRIGEHSRDKTASNSRISC